MYILVVNCGSSSLKLKLFKREKNDKLIVVFEARAEHLGSIASSVTVKESAGKKSLPINGTLNHKMALKNIIDYLVSNSVISSLADITCVGHRIVHGGSFFSEPTLICDKVLEKIDECKNLAPLHNPVNVMGIKCCQELLPKATQVAVFDTAFHQTIPLQNSQYAIPEEFVLDGIRKYGFHGTSYAYLTRTLSEILGGKDKICAIMAHIGQGVSVCAVDQGKSVSTSMEFSPLSGCIMGTRSGSIDPTVIQYIYKNYDYPVGDVLQILNKNSGLYSLTGTNNMLEILDGIAKNDLLCIRGFDIFCNSVAENIAKCIIQLGKTPKQIVFAGGIGENSDLVRATILQKLSPILRNIELDDESNKINATLISSDISSRAVYVIPTNEELEIAIQASKLI